MENNKTENSLHETQGLPIHKKKGIIKNIYRFFSKPIPLTVLNGVLIAIAIYTNFNYQAFCNPTPWATIVIAICVTNTILYPILEKTKLTPLTSFINGISLCLFIYCVLFIGDWNFFGPFVLMIGIVGLTLYIPHFFVVQLILKNIVKPKIKSLRYYFLASIILCIGISIYIGQEYKKAVRSIEKCKETNYQELDTNFMTEKILGMHFIYHTSYCPYDGWRPPKHEPILVIGMWFSNRQNNLTVDLKTRLELYKKFFPNNKYVFDCGCAGYPYQDDDLWK